MKKATFIFKNSKSKKLLLTLCILVSFLIFPFSSCNKADVVLKNIESNEQKLNFTLSSQIFDYDKLINNYDGPKTLGTIQTIIEYAVADCGSAWTAIKIMSRIPGVLQTGGYAGALAFLSGVVGSVAHYINKNYDFRPLRSISSNETSWTSGSILEMPKYFTYSEVGDLHNIYLDSTILAIDIGILSPSNTESIDSFILSKTNLVFETDVVVGHSLLDSIRNESFGDKTPQEIYNSYILNYSTPEVVASYLKEFYIRIKNTNIQTIEQTIDYADLFLDDVAQQSSFNDNQKELISYSISIYKSSVQYWNEKL